MTNSEQLNNCSDINSVYVTSAIAAVNTVNVGSANKSPDSDLLSRAVTSSVRHCVDDDDDDDDDDGGGGHRLSSILSDCENSPMTSEGDVMHPSFLPSPTACMSSPLPNKRLLSSSFRVGLNVY